MTEHALTPEQESTRRINQIKLIGIFAIAGVPVIVAMLMYFGSFAIPSGKTNKGELLLPPVALSEFGFQKDDRDLYPATDGRWMLFVAGANEQVCIEECQKLVHMARQVSVLLSRESDRMSRVLISASQAVDLSELRENYPQLEIIARPQTALPKTNSEWNLWISDPFGNVILRYDTSNTGYDLRDDLKKLLKLSNIG